MLEEAWVREVQPGEGTFFVISGFANSNGGIRFYEVFKQHIGAGGKVIAILGGSARQSMIIRQVVNELLSSGVEVHIVNRRRILHAKIYGTSSEKGDRLIVTPGNFTGPGLGQNVESAVILDPGTTGRMGLTCVREVPVHPPPPRPPHERPRQHPPRGLTAKSIAPSRRVTTSTVRSKSTQQHATSPR